MSNNNLNIIEKMNSQISPRTPTLSQQPKQSQQQPQSSQQQQQQQQQTKLINIQSASDQFKKKKFKKFIFRNYKQSNSPGIVVFLLKQINQEILESLFFEIFRKFYNGIYLPNFMYFDSSKKVIKFKQIKPETIVYFYITESDIDKNVNDLKYSEQQPIFNALDEQKYNLDIFILKESSYLDFLYGRYQLPPIQNKYTELQFFLEQCYTEIWDYIEDFAEVSHQRNLRLANVLGKLEKKREEIQDITKLMNQILNEFEQQEEQVRSLIKQMGFDEDFIEKSITVESRTFDPSKSSTQQQFQQQLQQSQSNYNINNVNNMNNTKNMNNRQSLKHHEYLMNQIQQDQEQTQQVFKPYQQRLIQTNDYEIENDGGVYGDIQLNEINDIPINHYDDIDMFLPKCAEDV